MPNFAFFTHLALETQHYPTLYGLRYNFSRTRKVRNGSSTSRFNSFVLACWLTDPLAETLLNPDRPLFGLKGAATTLN